MKFRSNVLTALSLSLLLPFAAQASTKTVKAENKSAKINTAAEVAGGVAGAAGLGYLAYRYRTNLANGATKALNSRPAQAVGYGFSYLMNKNAQIKTAHPKTHLGVLIAVPVVAATAAAVYYRKQIANAASKTASAIANTSSNLYNGLKNRLGFAKKAEPKKLVAESQFPASEIIA